MDETRNLVYVSTVASHRIVVIGTENSQPDQVLGWVAIRRGNESSVPLRAIAINPEIGPDGDGGHLWVVTSTSDGSEANEVLLIPKGWPANFHQPLAYPLDSPSLDGLITDRIQGRTYVADQLTPGSVMVLGDSENFCLTPFIKVEKPLILDIQIY